MSIDIRELGAIELANMAGVSPESVTSPGSKWLERVRDAYWDSRDEIRDESGDWQDAITRNVTDPVSAGLSDTEAWQVVTDLKLFLKQEQFDYGLYADSFERINRSTYRTEHVWAIEMNKLSDALRWWLYEIAGQLTYALREADEPFESDEEEEGNG